MRFSLELDLGIRNFIKKVKERSLSTGDPKAWWNLFGGIRTASGARVDQDSSLKFTAVLSAVSLRSDLIASSPLDIFINEGEHRRRDFEDQLYPILNFQPNPYMDAYTFWELNNTYLDLWGNAYNYITGSALNGVIALTPIHPANVEIRTETGKVIYRISNTGDRVLDGDHTAKKILHFKDITLDGIQGMSRILLAKEAIGLGLAAEKFGSEFFGNGSQARGVLEHPKQMGDVAYQRLKQSWDAKDNLTTPLLEEGTTYKQITIPPEAAQFIASREFQIQDVARVFRVPNHLINDLSKATFSNIEHQDISFVKYTLRPLAKRYESEMQIKLLGDDLGKKSIRFNLDAILRGDTKTRADYLTKMVAAKIFNRNEARAIENKNPVEGGEIFENPNTSTNTNNDGDNN